MQSVGNAECRKCRRWKMQSVENMGKQCGRRTGMLTNSKKNLMHHCIVKMCRVGVVIGVGKACAVH